MALCIHGKEIEDAQNVQNYIQNYNQSEIYIIIFRKCNKFLSSFYSFYCVYKNINLHKNSQSNDHCIRILRNYGHTGKRAYNVVRTYNKRY